jgi:hypothetical protein
MQARSSKHVNRNACVPSTHSRPEAPVFAFDFTHPPERSTMQVFKRQGIKGWSRHFEIRHQQFRNCVSTLDATQAGIRSSLVPAVANISATCS